MNNRLFQIAIKLLPGVGDVLAKNLISYCGSVEAVFRARKSHLVKVPGIGEKTAEAISRQEVLRHAEEELRFVEKYSIKTLFYTDEGYPRRLKHCIDSPVMLYYKGNADLNSTKVIAIVGTRKSTDYGKQLCKELCEGLARHRPLVISGLAYGIDINAHKESLKNGLQTIGVLGHGLDRIYPVTHKSTAEKMIGQGGLLTEFMSQTNPDRENFPARNRIIAGMVDCLVVVEAGQEGGALITADIANSYNRDVFAFPGRTHDEFSRGCNNLIRNSKAQLITSVADLEYFMGWEQNEVKKTVQQKLMIELSEEEKTVVALLQERSLPVDELSLQSNLPISRLAATLLNLEMSGVLRALPGKIYTLA